MIELQKVKRDIINYGALKVYTTFLTISEEEVDPELFAASQLKEIFEKKFDILKVNISFVEGEEAEVVGKELLIFKLSKCSDNEISYMSNVDDEGKISSLVLTKSGDEVSLEVVEYEVGGEEVPNVEEAPSGTISEALGLDQDGKVVKGAAASGGTKLYKHSISIGYDGGGFSYLALSKESSPFTISDFNSDSSFTKVSQLIHIVPTDSYILCGLQFYGNLFKAWGFDFSTGHFGEYSITSVSDTVTEL